MERPCEEDLIAALDEDVSRVGLSDRGDRGCAWLTAVVGVGAWSERAWLDVDYCLVPRRHGAGGVC